MVASESFAEFGMVTNDTLYVRVDDHTRQSSRRRSPFHPSTARRRAAS
jgi:hypothetical protein